MPTAARRRLHGAPEFPYRKPAPGLWWSASKPCRPGIRLHLHLIIRVRVQARDRCRRGRAAVTTGGPCPACALRFRPGLNGSRGARSAAIALEDIGGDALGNPHRRTPHRVLRKMCIACCRLHLCVTEQPPDHRKRHCQTNWMGPVEPTIEGSQTASWRHSAKAVERLSLKLPRL